MFKQMFKFRNKETYEKVNEVLSQYEGMVTDPEKDLFKAYSYKRAEMLVFFKTVLRKVWNKYPCLVLTDFLGLMNQALFEIQFESKQMAENYGKEMKREVEDGSKIQL